MITGFPARTRNLSDAKVRTRQHICQENRSKLTRLEILRCPIISKVRSSSSATCRGFQNWLGTFLALAGIDAGDFGHRGPIELPQPARLGGKAFVAHNACERERGMGFRGGFENQCDVLLASVQTKSRTPEITAANPVDIL